MRASCSRSSGECDPKQNDGMNEWRLGPKGSQSFHVHAYCCVAAMRASGVGTLGSTCIFFPHTNQSSIDSRSGSHHSKLMETLTLYRKPLQQPTNTETGSVFHRNTFLKLSEKHNRIWFGEYCQYQSDMLTYSTHVLRSDTGPINQFNNAAISKTLIRTPARKCLLILFLLNSFTWFSCHKFRKIFRDLEIPRFFRLPYVNNISNYELISKF